MNDQVLIESLRAEIYRRNKSEGMLEKRNKELEAAIRDMADEINSGCPTNALDIAQSVLDNKEEG